MFSREDFIKFIKKPTNEDVILYDTTLRDLLTLDVYTEYNNVYPLFKAKKDRYLFLRQRIHEYQETIKNVYLMNTSWSESDYFENLKNLKKTYSLMYQDVKKLETKLDVLQRKLASLNEKIQIQTIKEEKEAEERKEKIYNELQKRKDELNVLKLKLNSNKQELEKINSKIKNNEEDFKLLSKMEEEIKLGEYKCPYCGNKVNVHSDKSLIFKRLYKNIEQNKKELKSFLASKEKLNNIISYYSNEVKQLQTDIKNDLAFSRDKYNFYEKKSLEILKLEGFRDLTIKDIASIEKQLKNNSHANTAKYKELKEKITKNELSLENLKRIKEAKIHIEEDLAEYKNLEIDLKDILEVLNKYIAFLEIYFKIYEQKAEEFCGKKLKFKFYKLEDYKITEILDITYNGTSYTELPNETRNKIDKYLTVKFSILS